MTIHITATQLRKDVYHLLDQVNLGEPIEVKRKGKLIRMTPVENGSKLASLEAHSLTIIGDPDELVQVDWSDNWKSDL